MSNNYCVYKHTDEYGKSYVGMTKHGDCPNKRWQNGAKYRECPSFDKAIQTLGWDSFSHDILESGLSKEEAEEKERFWISKLQSNNPEFGYNLDSGGRVGFCHSKSTKEKISKSHFGIRPSDETKEKLRQIAKARPPMSQETKDKISKANKGFKHSKEECEARSRRAKGRVLSEEARKLISQRSLGNKKRAKKVICIETGVIFDSAMDATRYLGKKGNAVVACIHANCACGGFHWKYLE